MRIVLNPLTATLYAKDRSSLKDNNNILPMPSRISTVLMLIQTIRKNEESLKGHFSYLAHVEVRALGSFGLEVKVASII